MIKKVTSDHKVVPHKGKNLGGPCKTRAEAERSLRTMEFFKHKKG
jgi:hypothetical protein